METAIGSFVAGKSVARRLHQMVNPVLAEEAAAMKQRAEEGVYLNPKLPDFERRFLPNLQMGVRGEKNYGELLPVGHINALERWRESTKEARRVRHVQLEALKYIENTVLVDGMPVPPDAVSIAKTNGWDISALEAWVASSRNRGDRLPSLSSASMIDLTKGGVDHKKMFQFQYVATVFGVVCAILVILLIILNGQHSYTITNRTMVYALLWAPAGAILRWKLSSLNGTMTTAGWEWFPLGTFAANFIGSIISMVAIGSEYNMDSVYDVTNFWGVGTIRAVKVGLAGSLTTVSTFVAEINGFMRKSDHAYPYMLITICSCCAVASLCYGTLLLLREDVGDVY
jgi:fluoride ion exporter CrcB/FEX